MIYLSPTGKTSEMVEAVTIKSAPQVVDPVDPVQSVRQ